MDDHAIVELYWSRSESAIAESEKKYGPYCFSIAHSILSSREDAQECVNDTYLAAWNAMPPKRPAILSTFLGKITRRLSIDRWRSKQAYKRGGGQVLLALEELGECIPGDSTPDKAYDRKRFGEVFNRFLENLPPIQRQVFLCRYWYLDSLADTAAHFGFSESKTASMLHRTRKKLRVVLEKEGLL